MTEPDRQLLRSDLEFLRITPAATLAGRKRARFLTVFAVALAAACLIPLGIELGPKTFFASMPVIGAFGLLYWLLYREVIRRGLSENLVIFGFTPLTIMPFLLYTLTRRARPQQDPDLLEARGVDASALGNMGLIWSVALLGWLPFPPFMMNVIAYFALLALPRRVDTDGVSMRSLPFRPGKRYLWSECRSFQAVRTEVVGILIRGAFNRELRLKFSNGVVKIRTPIERDAPEYTFALRMLDRFHVTLDGSRHLPPLPLQ
jgi:hypothetical protein